MRILKTIVNFLRLPIDFLLLTFHYVKGVSWLIYNTLLIKLFHRPSSPSEYFARLAEGKQRGHVHRWPYGCFKKKTSTGASACLPGKKYGNLFLFRSLCPDTARETETCAECYCHEKLQMTRSYWRPPLLRLFGVGVFLVSTWSLFAYLVYRGLPSTAHREQAQVENLLAMSEKLVEEGRIKEAIFAYQNVINLVPKDPNLYFELGKCFAQINDITDAFNTFKETIRLNPKMWEAHLEIAKLTDKPGDYHLCGLHAKKVTVLNPNSQEGHYLLASALAHQNLVVEARAVLETLQKFKNLDSHDYAAIGELFTLTQDIDQAQACMAKALELDPANTDARIGLAYSLSQQNQWDQASEHIEEVLSQDPENLKGLIGQAEILAGKMEVQSALDAYEKILQLYPTNPNVATRLARLYLKTNAEARGLEILQKVIDHYPGHVGANSLSLETNFKQGRYRLAIQHAQRILAVPNDSHDYARKLLARCYLAIKQFDLAITTNREILEKFPGDFDAKLGLAYALDKKGKSEEATNYYRQAAQINPESEFPYQYLANLYARKNQIDEAIASYREALERAPQDRATANNLAMLLIKNGQEEDLEEAYELSQGLVEKYTDNALVTDTLGWVLYHQREYDRAKEMFERAIRLDAYIPDSYYHLGKTFLKKNELELAVKNLENALKLSSHFSGAKDARMLLAEIQEER